MAHSNEYSSTISIESDVSEAPSSESAVAFRPGSFHDGIELGIRGGGHVVTIDNS